MTPTTALAWGVRGLVLLVPVLGFIVTILAGWPAGISPDMATTIFEGAGFFFNGHQAPLFSAVWSLPLAFLSPAIAIAMFYLLQVCGYWLGFALLGGAALRRNSPIAAVLAALGGFLPPLFAFVGRLESNVQVGVAWALAIAIACTRPGTRSLLLSLPLIFYGFVVRHGLILAVGPIVFACVTLACPGLPWRRAALRSVLTTATFALAAAAVTWMLGAPSSVRLLSVSRLTDIAGVYQLTGTHCVPASLVPAATTAEAVMADYDPSYPANMIWRRTENSFLRPDSEEAFAGLKSCWSQTVRRHPKEYLQVRARFALIFLMIGTEGAQATQGDYSWNARFGLSVPSNSFATAKATYVEQSRAMLVWRGWFWLVLTGGACVIAFVRGVVGSIPATAVFAGAFGTLVPHLTVGHGASSRHYFLPYILCVVSLLIFWARPDDRATPVYPDGKG